MLKYIRLGLLFALVFGISAQSGLPQPRGKRAALRGLRPIYHYLSPGTALTPSPGNASWIEIDPVHLTARVPGYGRFSIVLTQARRKNWKSFITNGLETVLDPADLVFFKGEITQSRRDLRIEAGGLRALPVAATLVKNAGKTRLEFVFNRNSFLQTRRLKLARLIVELSSRKDRMPAAFARELLAPRMRRIMDDFFLEVRGQSGTLNGAQQQVSPQGGMWLVKISTDADSELYRFSGPNTNALIAMDLINTSVIFETQLNVTFEILQQHVFTDSAQPYSSTDSVILIDQFRSYTEVQQHLGDADLYLLLTGKNLDGNYIGRASGGVCSISSRKPFALVQHYSVSMDPLIIAHEIGHNFGAGHDDSDKSNIMSSVLSEIPEDIPQFTQKSRGEIWDWLSVHLSCLDPSAGPAPLPTPIGAPDRTAPKVRAYRSRGFAGSYVSLIHLIRDNSRVTRQTFRIFQGDSEVASWSTLFKPTRRRGRDWEAYDTAQYNQTPGIYRFCVQAEDQSANKTERCARLRLLVPR